MLFITVHIGIKGEKTCTNYVGRRTPPPHSLPCGLDKVKYHSCPVNVSIFQKYYNGVTKIMIL